MFGRSMFGRGCRWLLAILLVSPMSLRGQSGHTPDAGFPVLPPRVLPPPTIGPVGIGNRPPLAPPVTFGFKQLAQAAGTIFSGTVTAIAREPASPHRAIDSVAVTFHIEQAIRGATPGEDFTIYEWMGLWSGGQSYRVGDRVLVFLYRASKLGLTSCVAGGLGKFRVDTAGRVVLTAQQLSAFHPDPLVGGKSRARFGDFVLAVQRAGNEGEE